MTMHETEQDGVVILSPHGRLDSGAVPGFEPRLMAAAARPSAAVLVDLSGVEYISSAGMRILLLAAKRARQGGGELRLCGAPEHVLDVLEISGLIRAFRIHPAADVAVREMRPGA